MNEKVFLDYICQYAVDYEWDEPNVKEQIRSLFTTWCLVCKIDADTMKCDRALNRIYFEGALEELLDYDEFEQFMLEYLI